MPEVDLGEAEEVEKDLEQLYEVVQEIAERANDGE